MLTILQFIVFSEEEGEEEAKNEEDDEDDNEDDKPLTKKKKTKESFILVRIFLRQNLIPFTYFHYRKNVVEQREKVKVKMYHSDCDTS